MIDLLHSLFPTKKQLPRIILYPWLKNFWRPKPKVISRSQKILFRSVFWRSQKKIESSRSYNRRFIWWFGSDWCWRYAWWYRGVTIRDAWFTNGISRSPNVSFLARLLKMLFCNVNVGALVERPWMAVIWHNFGYRYRRSAEPWFL